MVKFIAQVLLARSASSYIIKWVNIIAIERRAAAPTLVAGYMPPKAPSLVPTVAFTVSREGTIQKHPPENARSFEWVGSLRHLQCWVWTQQAPEKFAPQAVIFGEAIYVQMKIIIWQRSAFATVTHRNPH